MTATANDQIRILIHNFAVELEELVRRTALESVQEVLHGGAVPRVEGRRGTARGPAAARRKEAARPEPGKRGKRSGAEVDAASDKLLKYIAKHPGERMEQISAGMKMTSKDLNLPLRKLKDDGRLKTKGQKRATEYYAK